MTNEYQNTPVEYDGDQINHFIPKSANTRYLEIIAEHEDILDVSKKLDEVLRNPLDSSPLQEIILEKYETKKPLVILVDDNTRPNIHTRELLPFLLPKLKSMNVVEEDITILIASGTHRPPTSEEIKKKILGPEIWDKYKHHVKTHNCDEGVKKIGTSSRNTPIYLNELVVESPLVITLTDSEYHYFAGVAGTVKQLFPGVAGRKTIARNHPNMFDKETGFRRECRLGNTKGNPVIQDMIEMTEKVKENRTIFCIDTVLHRKQIVYINAGDIVSLHKIAHKVLKPLREIKVQEKGDLVIISCGELGLNLYQAGKGIHAAWNAVKPGGKILILAKAQDGVGNEAYHETMTSVKDMSLDDALRWVIDNKCSETTFRIGNQKPVDLLRILKNTRIDMITEMDPRVLKEIYRINHIESVDSMQQTLRRYVRDFLSEKKSALIYVMADAGISVVPD